jgi:hypothetical protein
LARQLKVVDDICNQAQDLRARGRPCNDTRFSMPQVRRAQFDTSRIAEGVFAVEFCEAIFDL